MLTIILLLVLLALAITIIHGMNKGPLWPAVLLLVLVHLLGLLPLR